MILDCAVYENGGRRAGALDLEEAGAASQASGSFVWMGVYEPDEEEFDAIQREFQLHELAVEDAINAHQRPKLEVYGDTLFVVLKTVRYVEADGEIETGEILVFANAHLVLTVRHGQASALGEVRRRIESRPDLLGCGPGAVLYGIVDQVVDDYEPATHALEADIQQVEREVFSPERTNPAARIYGLEREVIEFHRSVAPLAPAVDRLARGQFDLIDPDLRTYFRDVHDHLMRVEDRIRGFRGLLSSALQANLTQATVRQNEDMRKISAWIAIAAVPTLIAGIYGMNFQHIPELGEPWGFPAIIVLMAALCVLLHRRLRRSGWL